MEPIYKFLENQIGLGGLVLLIVIGFISFLVWKLAVLHTRHNEKIANLPCDRHEQSLDILKETTNDIKLSLIKLETILAMSSGTPNIGKLTQSHSPISLSPEGKKIANSLKYEDILNKNWDKISSIIAREKNPYDIQVEFITKLITDYDKYVDAASIDNIKNDAFLRGIPLIEYLRMLGIMARDRYFSEHSINIGDVDANDPIKN